MSVIWVVVIIGAVALLLEKSQGSISSGLSGVVPPPSAVKVAPAASNAGEEASAAQSISAGLNFIPVAGPAIAAAFNALTGGLIAASQKRAAEARTENSAVAAAVPGWDDGVAQSVAMYNNGKITAAQLQQIVMAPQVNDPSIPSGQGILWQNYWSEVGPQVQPGRNGCQSGSATQPPNQSWCSGSYGAGCCVAYDDLKNGSVYILQALNVAESRPGVPVTSKTVPMVVGSKYGGVNRNGYTVTLTKPVSQPSTNILAL